MTFKNLSSLGAFKVWIFCRSWHTLVYYKARKKLKDNLTENEDIER